MQKRERGEVYRWRRGLVLPDQRLSLREKGTNVSGEKRKTGGEREKKKKKKLGTGAQGTQSPSINNMTAGGRIGKEVEGRRGRMKRGGGEYAHVLLDAPEWDISISWVVGFCEVARRRVGASERKIEFRQEVFSAWRRGRKKSRDYEIPGRGKGGGSGGKKKWGTGNCSLDLRERGGLGGR